MRQYVGIVGPKGQITLPSEVRKELGIGPKDRVVIKVEAGSAVVRRAQSSLLEGYRSIKPLIPGLTDEEMDKIVERYAVQEALRESGDD
jgi:AbrB family looped-hinge helix DNA binding protein